VSAHASQPLRLPRFQRPGGLARVTRSPFARLVTRRLLAAIPVLWGVTLLTFVTMNALPGDAAQQLLGANASPDQVHQLEVKLGLDQPFLTRYWDWFKGVVSGDLGHSLANGQSVGRVLGQALPITFELIAYAFVFSLLFAVPLALLSARRPNGILDRITMLLSMGGLSIANYVLALLLVWLFAVQLGWLPALGWVPPGQSIGQNLRYLTLPAVSIGLPLLCFYTRLLRADLLEQLQSEDYVVTARAKGVGPWAVLMRHTLRNSVFGLITIVALNLGTLLGVTVIIEDIFSVPGMGRELLSAINTRDVPVVEGAVLVFAVVVVAANFLADILYSLLDPRIRYGGTGS
jgi:peptide/nickel transport system permease protein